MTQLLPPKKEVALALLERSNVDVYLDPRAKGVVVPPQFRKEPRLILKIGLNMPVPIPDLRLDDESMSCTLSFNRAKFFCVVPWLSVFAMVGDDGRGMVWPDDVPQELAVRVVDDKRPSSPQAVRDQGPRDGREGDAMPASSRGAGKGKSRLQADAPKDSDRSEAASSSSGGRRGRPKKKKDEPARPVLVAVPPPEKSSPRIEKLDDRRDARDGAAERAAPTTPRVSGDGPRPGAPSRPKRELPPYLRVVK
jgi:stringent starvation protein B